MEIVAVAVAAPTNQDATSSDNSDAQGSPSEIGMDSMKLYWEVSERLGEDGKKDILFNVINPGCPASQNELKNDVERTLSAIKIIFENSKDGKFEESFAKLLRLAQLGLIGLTPDTTSARYALESLKHEIVAREGGRIKNSYMRTLGIWALGFSLCAVIAYFITDNYLNCRGNIKNFFLIWGACMAGTWCSFAARKLVLTFDDLSLIEEDRLDPPIRLIFSGLLTLILSLVFITGFAEVQVGSFKTSEILMYETYALLFGAFCGLAEKALPASALNKANAMVKASDGP